MSLATDLFSDIFARQDNVLTRVDARTKLIVALGVIVSVLLSTKPIYPLLVFPMCIGGTIAVGVPARYVALRCLAPLGMASIILLLQGVLTGSTPTAEFAILGRHVVFTVEGFAMGLLLASRVIGAVSVVILLSSVTPVHSLFRGLRAMGVSKDWVEIAMLMYRYTFAFLDIAADMVAAQKVRLGYSGARRGLSSLGTVAGTILLRSVDQAVRTNEAMRVRGYRGDIPLGPLPKLSIRDFGIVLAAFAFTAALYLYTEGLLR